MTEKRFKLAYEKGNWWAVRDGDITLWKEEVIHLLNELSDENEQLKQQIEDCKDVNVRCCNDYSAMRRDVWKYKKENEQLKQQHRQLQIEFNDACGIVHDLRESKLDLEDENEQLKQRIKQLEDNIVNKIQIISGSVTNDSDV